MSISVLRRYLLAGLCVLLAMPAMARELLAVGTNFPGIFEQQADGELSGLAIPVLNETLEPLGHHLRFELYPWARAQQMVATGRADILIGPYKNAEREMSFVFAARPFYRDSIVFFGLRSRALQWQGEYSQLHGRRIGVVRGWAYGVRFDSLREELELITVENVANGLRMLGAGRLDLLASNPRNTRPVLEALNLSEAVSQLEPQIDQQDGYFAFSRHPAQRGLREEFDRAFAALIDQGRLAQLAAERQIKVP